MDSRDIHILAVDDSYLDRKVVERLLVNSSYKVTTVDSALRALEVLGIVGTSPVVINAVKINLIITDYCMPEMTGYDLLKKVKESSVLKEIPVVIMSSENVAERITMCLAEGAKEFILKPLRAADVKRLRTHVMHEDGVEDSDSSSVFKRKPAPVAVPMEELPGLLKRPRRFTENSTEIDNAPSTTSSRAQEGDGSATTRSSEPRSSSSNNNNNNNSGVLTTSPRGGEVLDSEKQEDSISLEKPVIVPGVKPKVSGDGLSSPDDPSSRSFSCSSAPSASPRSVSSTQEPKPASSETDVREEDSQQINKT